MYLDQFERDERRCGMLFYCSIIFIEYVLPRWRVGEILTAQRALRIELHQV